MSIAATMRESLLAGGEWTDDLVVERFDGASRSNLSMLIKQMRTEGYEFESRKVDPEAKYSKSAYKLTDFRPSEARIEQGKQRWRAKNHKKKKPTRLVESAQDKATDLGPIPDPSTLSPAPRRPHPTIVGNNPLPQPCPQFGSSLRVVLLSEATDGAITIGLRNGTVTYVAELVGVHAPGQSGQSDQPGQSGQPSQP